MHSVIAILAHAGLLWLLVYLFPYDATTSMGVLSSADWQLYFAGGVILGLLNSILKPLLKVVGFPFAVLSFGLFALVINGVLLLLLERILAGLNIPNVTFSIHGAGYFILSVAIFTVFNILYATFIRK